MVRRSQLETETVGGGMTASQRLEEGGNKRNESRLTPERLSALTAVDASLTLVLWVTFVCRLGIASELSLGSRQGQDQQVPRSYRVPSPRWDGEDKRIDASCAEIVRRTLDLNDNQDPACEMLKKEGG